MKISRKINIKIEPIFLFPVYLIITIIFISFIFNLLYNNKEEKIIGNAEGKYLIKVYSKDKSIKQYDIDEYLIGVVAAEMPPSFEIEALKAQAVAARTYIINRKNDPDDTHRGADVCEDPGHCKAYINESEAIEKWGMDWNDIYRDKIKKAVYDTKGLIITYDDEPISAVFHSTSSGRTENSEDVWQTPQPYLKSVESPGEELSPRYKSTVEFTLTDFKNKITEIDTDAVFPQNKNDWISNYKYTQGGSVRTVDIAGVTIKGTDIRKKFGLRSACFFITAGDKIIFNVTGNGHGVGMSQYGANYAASNGSDFRSILKKYYINTDLKKIY